MELGLERVHAVLDNMGLRRPPYAAIAITGTNGKGSTTAMCEAILRRAGYKVGAYTSPHLIAYNERVRLDGRDATDAELCGAFERIEAARGTVPLTYFEFGTLAAFDLFRSANIDIAVLEVGMGGRLDAVNAIDPDVSIVTAVDIDHVAWLGSTREAIGREKAGIFRAGRAAICGDPNPPAIIAAEAARIGARLLQVGHDFQIERSNTDWTWRSGERLRAGLPHPSLRGDYQLYNAACALTALEALVDRFPVTQADVREGLLSGVIPGRFQVLPGRPMCVLDVAHNAQAARSLAATLKQQRIEGRTLAVFGMLKDKDIVSVVGPLAELVDRWYPASLHLPRGATAVQLVEALTAAGVPAPAQTFDDVHQAWATARRDAGEADRIVVFGSFHTVGDILAALGKA
ncbi:bifunctional tetrahydrofolate synthase/dihydrofolate synthase [Sulfuricaulis limicola]|uniref:bifunctional tetrahydrofolate synthase/dihydrofolate synthase n=1 Tax=Sulfuricaulis limicola TaxID=1620215 RepID=UPI001E4F90E1